MLHDHKNYCVLTGMIFELLHTVADKKKFQLRLRSTLNAYMENSYKTFTKR